MCATGKTLSTKLASNGGCCIWYDEPSLFGGVQKRLGAQIGTLDAFLASTPGGVGALNATLGQGKDGGLNAATAEHLSYLAPSIAELAALEVTAQQSFLLGVLYQANGGALPAPPPMKSRAGSASASSGHGAAAAPAPASGGSGSGGGAPAAAKRSIKEASDGPDHMDIADEDEGGQQGGKGGGARGSGKHRRHRGRGGGAGGGGGRG